ncbi:Susd and RagB outer membrane lipoprotein [Dyadobacter sp. SG02]|uniref:SusD/RagB family nutrient-binding outer membrane lipoprotein n=1 Tax=Dyadobacter sp. SG02 TaxID=1855291 RepID=UPI0008B3A763|nr:SusD/RagB family nutrient-binding outer membrane lipoprotein [Dyadobacter sp. SG02]SEJ36657.1 Susd and RagB outer membrane lipoprotein [Dyadobacter sp. SG02]
MRGKFKISGILLFVVLMIASSCSDFVDINNDPNNPTEPTLALLLPATQMSLAGYFNAVNTGGSAVMQHFASGNLNRWNQSGSTFSTAWSGFYTATLPDLETIIREGTAQQAWGYVAIAKLQKAYLYSIMVDLWGDVPYSQAVGEFTDPALDKGATIYASLFELIDQALADMEKGFTVAAGSDVFYQGSKLGWQRMANSLKLKMLIQTRLVDPAKATAGIKALLTGDVPLITDNAHDFVFQYGTNVTPNARHPWYTSWYSSGRGGYVSMPLVNKLKDSDDPRLRYYVFRQNANVGLANSMNGEGFYGREPGDGTASPADANTRALIGIYPAAGLYDNGTIKSLTASHIYLNNTGAVSTTTSNSFKIPLSTSGDGTGAGILPLITSSMVNFMRAEAALALGTGEDAAQLVADAVAGHLNRVSTLAGANKGTVMPASTITGFTERIKTQFTGASEAGKMDILMTQKWIALFGNGIESYNDYRRTGLPKLSDLVSPLDVFPMRFYYSETELTSNELLIADREAIQRAQQTTPVFWDK